MRVLVVENDKNAADELTTSLRRHGYAAESVATGGDAMGRHRSFDLMLMDLELPDVDGLEVCRGIRAGHDVPIIAVTGRSSELDRVLALQAGVDDYMVKPYGFRELVARIEAIMRRVRRQTAVGRAINHGCLQIDPARREVMVDDKPVSLTRKEFDFLHLLASDPDTVVTRERIMTEVWEYDSVAASRTIDTHVSSLRAKLGAPNWILTIRGVGFRIGPA